MIRDKTISHVLVLCLHPKVLTIGDMLSSSRGLDSMYRVMRYNREQDKLRQPLLWPCWLTVSKA
jgi:hypothetical protein